MRSGFFPPPPGRSPAGSMALLAVVALLGPAPALAAGQHSESTLIVKFRSVPRVERTALGTLRSGSAELDAVLQRFHVHAIDPLFPLGGRRELRDRLGLDRFRLLRTGRPVDIPAAVQALGRIPEIELAEPDYIAVGAGTLGATQSALVPNDPAFGYQWALRNTGANPIPLPKVAGADIKATDAWDITRGDAGILVAILDSGLRMDHPEFAGRIWTNPGEIPNNQVDDDGNGFMDDSNGYDFVNQDEDPSDDHGHGTFVTSILGATGNNGQLIAGVDWSCRILPLKVLNSINRGVFSDWAAAMVYAANAGARVISMSLVGYDDSAALAAAARYAYESGCFTAAAMGNDDATLRSIPAVYDDWVTAVGSTDPSDDRCTLSVCGYGSNYGSHIDVVAPGVYVAALSYTSTTGFVLGGGTSAATPLVAGLASLLLARDPSLNPDQVADLIRFSADDQVGRPEEDTAGFDLFHGHGRINCQRALLLVSHAGQPIVTAPSEILGSEGVPLLVEISAADPDGDAIQELTADLSSLPAGHDATFEVSSDYSSGSLRWVPGYAHAGIYPVTFTATSPFRGRAVSEIRVANVNDAPTLTLPEEFATDEARELVAEVFASDADGDPITELVMEPLPSGAVFETSADKRTGRLRWTPGYDQQGSYPVRFVARSTSVSPPLTLEVSANGSIEVLDVDTRPIVTLPARVEGIEGEPLSVSITARDPDGDPITDLQAAPLPSGAVFQVSPDLTEALLTWTPAFTQAGAFFVAVSVQSTHPAAPGAEPVVSVSSREVLLDIADTPDHPPVVHAPAEATVAEGTSLSVAIQASDPDGDDIIALGASPLPAGATFTPDAQDPSATLAWTPGFDQAGSYSVTLSAQSAHRASPVSEPVLVEGFAHLQIHVLNTDRAPLVTAPSALTVDEGRSFSFQVTASDPDGDPIASLASTHASLSATFSEDASHESGDFNWTPTYADAGTYPISFVASNSLVGQALTVITVRNVNRAPEPRPGGPYAGVVGSPIAFDGSASLDPDGTELGFHWDFGDLETASGPSPIHTYASGGVFPVTLEVNDGELTATGSTTATVQLVLPARAFPDVQDRTIRLMAAKPTWCLRVEPVGSSYDNTAVDGETLALLSPGTGSVERISAIAGKTSAVQDEDRNGVEEIAVRFAKEDLRRLFEDLPPGSQRVPVTLEGSLRTGGMLRASLELTVVPGTGPLATSFAPSPTRREGALSIRMDRAGSLSVRIYDAAGRLVRSLFHVASSPSGYHEVAFDGRDAAGRELRSGVYFYRVESSGSVAAGRIVLLR